MKQINTGGTPGLPLTCQTGVSALKTKNRGWLSGLSRSLLLLSSIFILSFHAGKASATALPTATFSCTRSTTATTSCVSGAFASGWSTGGTDYWQYTVNTAGYSLITMSVATSSSATGPHTANVYYNVGGSDVFVTSYSFTGTTCSSSGVITFPSACNNQPTLTVKIKMSGATSSAGTNRINSNGGFTGIATAFCSGTPLAGTVAASPSSICGSGSSALTLTPGSAGSDLTFQWYDGSGAVSGATNLNYTTPTISATSTYSVVTTCPTSGFSSAAATATVTVNALPSIAPISPSSATISTSATGTSTQTFTETTGGGVWSSGSSSVATIGSSSGIATATLSPGTTTIRYTVNSAGCFASVTATLNTVAVGTLATYTANDGVSTTVTPEAANETVGALTPVNFGATSTCSSGGLSGITVNTVYATYTAGTNPYVYFQIFPTAGHHLNVTGMRGITRESATGPTEARFAYSLDGGLSWTDNLSDIAQTTSGSCGDNSNIMSWSGFTPVTADATNGIWVAIYPFHPGASSGSFQVQNISVDGSSLSDDSCNLSTPTAGTVSPASSVICSGTELILSRTGGTTYADQTYQWYDASGPISGATDPTLFNVPFTSVTVVQSYSVVTTCPSGSSSAATATVTVNPVPDAGTITGSTTIINTGTTLALSDGTPGGVWSSSFPVVAVVGTTGVVTGLAPGFADINYSVTALGCTGVAIYTIQDITPGDMATYTGFSGISTDVTGVDNETVTSIVPTGFGVATPCTSGGLSGITVSTVVATYDSLHGPYVSFDVTPAAGYRLDISGFSVITRESSTGPAKARLSYSLDGGTTWTSDFTDHLQVTGGSCGANSNSFSWAGGLTLLNITSTIRFAVFPYAPTSSTGTFQVNAMELIGVVTTTTTCTSMPATGIAVATLPSHCGSGSSLLGVTGGSSDAGLQYEWHDGTGAVITGATNATYITGTISATQSYSVITTCPGNGSSTSSTATVTINPLPSAGTVTGTSPIPTSSSLVTSTSTFSSTGDAGGVWSSNNATVATIGSSSGVATATEVPGSSIIRYSVTSLAGCFASATATLNTVPQGTLATYAGTGGTSTSVTAEASNETVNPLSSTGFGTATPCTTGGLSGITVNTVNVTFDQDSAHVYYQVLPNTGFELNVTNLRAITRESGAGPTGAAIAYSLDNGATWTGDAGHVQLTNGSCGASSNIFEWSGSAIPDVTSTTDGILVGIYPYAPGANTGTFQVNYLLVDGTVNSLGSRHAAPAAVTNINSTSDINLYPNPADMTLNISASQKVNVSILSIDGKELIAQKDAASINVSSLVPGLYLVKIYDQENNLIKTAKFTKN